MNIWRLISSYILEPFIIWTIFFEVILHLTFVHEISELVRWILESQIYLVIFTTSFVFLYFRQTYPIYKKNKDIKKAQIDDNLVIPRIMLDKSILDISLWLGGGVLFFSDLMMSFGIMYSSSIANKELYHQLEWELPILGFILVPMVSGYYTMRLRNHFKKLGIKLEKVDPEIMFPILIMVFFITLGYVATQNILS